MARCVLWRRRSPPSLSGSGSDPPLDRVEVPPSNRLLLYTDGLADALDRAGKRFDLGGAARGLVAGPLETAIARLIDQLNSHTRGHLNDDVAVMVLEPFAERLQVDANGETAGTPGVKLPSSPTRTGG